MTLIPVFIQPIDSAHCDPICPFKRNGNCSLFNEELQFDDSGNNLFYERSSQCQELDTLAEDQP